MTGRESTWSDGQPSEETSRLVAASQRVRAWRAEVTEPQAAAMQAVDDACRAGEVTDADAAEIEVVIRRGYVRGARKRLTEARRRHRSVSP